MITVEVDSRPVLDALEALRLATRNMEPAMDDVGQTLVSAIHLSMGKGQTPWGDAFEPLKYRAGVPLNDTRQHIYNRITSRATNNSVEVGLFDSDSNKIGRVHQFGATIKPKKGPFLIFQPRGFDHPFFARKVTIPARPFLPIREDGAADLPKEWQASVIEVIQNHLRQALGKP